MKYIFTLIGALLLASSPAQAQTIIVLDSWWSVDYARQSCDYVGPPDFWKKQPDTACKTSAAAEERDFETRLITQFAVSPNCSSVALSAYGGPAASSSADEAVKKADWVLFLDYTLGAEEQNWTMQRSFGRKPAKGEPQFFKAAGSPQKIARDVCTIANRYYAK